MREVRSVLASWVLLAALVGCGSDGNGGGPGLRWAGDVTGGVDVHAGADLPPTEDARTAEDLPRIPDVPQVADVPQLADVPQAADVSQAADIPSVEDAPVALCSDEGSVAGLRSCPQGDLAYLLRSVVVTYVYGEGFFVQDDSGAILVYAGDPPAAPLPAVGEVIDLPVLRLSEWHGRLEVTRFDVQVVVGAAEVAEVTLDLSGGTRPSEELENRLVRVEGLTVTAAEGEDLRVSYGSAVGVTLRVDRPEALCVGGTLSIPGVVVTAYDGAYRLQSYDVQSDLTELDTRGCTLHDTANWGFELEEDSDPPPGFLKATEHFTAVRTTDVRRTGEASCALRWDNAANQDLYQGLFVELGPGEVFRFDVWAHDNDESGRVRAAAEYYDANHAPLGKEYGEFSRDEPDWQNLWVEATGPDGAAFARGFVRMYDVTGDETTVFIDDWSVGEAGE